MARISICLPVYNGANLVTDALRSIERQTTRDHVVLASDNGSTDASRQILEEWGGKIAMDLCVQPKTLPMRDHFNALLERVRSDYYMLLCHDDYFYTDDALQRAVEIMDADQAISAVYCDLAYVSEKGRLLASRRFARAGAMSGEQIGRQSIATTRNMFGIPLLIRTAALGSKRYDPQFHYVMDVDLSWEISAEGPAWHIPRPMIANRYMGANTTWSLLAQSEMEYLRLAHKRGIALTPAFRYRLKLTNYWVNLKRQAFNSYERVVTALG